jgi:SAM-dependent methyltransferase
MVCTIVLFIFTGISGFIILWLTITRIVRKLIHFPAPAWIGGLLDSNYRRFLQPPDTIIQRSGITEGMKVLEIGCGSGAYTTYVAEKIGPKGSVYALDTQQKMLDQLENKLKKPRWSGITNINLIKADAYTLPFSDHSFDLVYLITVLPEIPDQGRALSEIKRVLKPGGFISVNEFFPDPDYPLKSTTIKRLKAAGFEIDRTDGFLWTYTVKGKKPA